MCGSPAQCERRESAHQALPVCRDWSVQFGFKIRDEEVENPHVQRKIYKSMPACLT